MSIEVPSTMSGAPMITSSDFHVHVYGAQLRRRACGRRWHMSCDGSDFVPLPVRQLAKFAHDVTAVMVELLVKSPPRRHAVLTDETAARLHAAGAVNLRTARVNNRMLIVPKARFGDYEVPALIVPRAGRETAKFNYAVVGDRHLSLV